VDCDDVHDLTVIKMAGKVIICGALKAPCRQQFIHRAQEDCLGGTPANGGIGRFHTRNLVKCQTTGKAAIHMRGPFIPTAQMDGDAQNDQLGPTLPQVTARHRIGPEIPPRGQ